MGCLLKANGLYSRTTIGAVLLAAGAGSRLGGRPKALLELGGVPLILRQLIALSGAGVDEVVVVLGHHAAAIEAAVQSFPITLAHNPAPDEGQAASVRVGLRALSPRLDAVIVALADQPLIDAQDITALISAFKKRGDAAMVVPRVRGDDGVAEPGNPVIFEAALRDEWLAGSADAACRRWRLANPERVRWLDTDNRRYWIDIDTPEDIERFTAATGHVLSWPSRVATEAAS
ncbi:nucleotidyltransferase family protein [Rivibacter subsaxonicus]|uniref:Molybdenum cofactor cytidylyltransferase n=1 Tax=Rivibacter subsaxonicus TaxID=457575 RepID=A0A4Q7VCK6_9BURK|nr:nucleotidyltransferase family protein [Rivibacter subsaxonicus]RZT93594.1 molybdenum cofactor cytidylyltransferase [Rivibacter subsaxonicus]